MIGVLADDADHPVVREFFELFKTPWEFFRQDRQYEILFCCASKLPKNSAKLLLVFGSDEKPFDEEQGIACCPQQAGVVLSFKKDRIPIYGKCLMFSAPAAHGLTDEITHESAAVLVVSEGRTLVRLGFDLFQEVRQLLTLGQPIANAPIPALELHIALLRDIITNCSMTLVEIPPVPAGYSFIACLTHDVDHVGIRHHRFDHTMFGFLYRAVFGSVIRFIRGRMSAAQVMANWLAVLSLPFVHLGVARDFWYQFDRYLEIEKGLGSTFFVIPYPDEPGLDANGLRPTRRAARYDAGAIGDQLRGLRAAGCEIGLHGIDAWRDRDKGSAERDRISEITGASNPGVRMHWLYFGENSLATLERAGFPYDSTVGYNETVGYRAGTTQAYKPLGLERIMELPMHIMDTALFYPAYLNLSPQQGADVVGALVENAVRFGGVLTVNWHDRSVAPERLWDGFYLNLLADLKRRGAWFPTASQSVAWFQKRRAATFEDVSSEAGAVRIKASVQADDGLPGLRIRVHPPAAKECVDIEFNHDIDTRIAT